MLVLYFDGSCGAVILTLFLILDDVVLYQGLICLINPFSSKTMVHAFGSKMKSTVLFLTLWTLVAMIALDGKVLAQDAKEDSTDATPTNSDTAASPSASSAGLLGVLGNPIGQLKDAFTIKGQPPKPHKPGAPTHEEKHEEHEKAHDESHATHEDNYSSSNSHQAPQKEKVVVEKEPVNAGTGITGMCFPYACDIRICCSSLSFR